MPTDTIQQLIADCRAALATAPETGPETKATFKSLGDRLAAVEGEWKAAGGKATDAQGAQWHAQLTELHDLLAAIQEIGRDGPTNTASEMHKDYASNRRIYGIVCWAIIVTVGIIVFLWVEAMSVAANGASSAHGLPAEVAHAIPLVAVMGALGGILNCIQSFGLYVGNRQFRRSWTLYYWLFPIKGAGLAIIVFFLIHTDLGSQLSSPAAQAVVPARTNLVLLPAAWMTNLTVGAGGQITTDIMTNLPASRIELVSQPIAPAKADKPNLVLACLIAALTGMFANQAIEMLASVFAVLFKKVEGKDAYQDNQTKGAAPTKPAAN